MRFEQADSPARQGSLRRHNLGLVLRELVAAGPCTRAELARRTGLTKATISGFVETLASAGFVEDAPDGPRSKGAPGRPASPLRLGPAAPLAAGVEIGVDFLSCCVAAPTGEVLARRWRARDHRAGAPQERLADVAAEVAALVATVRGGGDPRGNLGHLGRVAGVGVALPGVVGPGGRVLSAPNLPTWKGLDVRDMLVAELQRTAGGGRAGLQAPGEAPFVVEVGNEADLGALGELWYGGHRGLSDFALVSAEVGVGAGIVVGGRLFSGATGAAGELGHLTIDPDGPACGCGSRGCLERYAGKETLLEAAGVRDLAGLRAGADRGDPAAVAALSRAGSALGLAAAALVNVVDVPTLLLGGIYAELGAYLLPALSAELRVRAVRHLWDPVRLLLAALGPQAAMRGAAGSVLERVLSDPAVHLPEVAG
ncbi:MAG: ROK family protein [Acidimicrobiales bacterium]